MNKRDGTELRAIWNQIDDPEPESSNRAESNYVAPNRRNNSRDSRCDQSKNMYRNNSVAREINQQQRNRNSYRNGSTSRNRNATSQKRQSYQEGYENWNGSQRNNDPLETRSINAQLNQHSGNSTQYSRREGNRRRNNRTGFNRNSRSEQNQLETTETSEQKNYSNNDHPYKQDHKSKPIFNKNNRLKLNLSKNHETRLQESCSSVDDPPEQQVWPMSLAQIKELVTKDPTEIVLTIISSKKFNLLLDQPTEKRSRDITAYIWLALGKSVTAHLSKNLNSMVNMITSNTVFMDSVKFYLASFQKYPSQEIHLNSLVSMIDFLYKYQITLPSSAFDFLLVTLPLLEKICKMYLTNDDNSNSEVLNKLQDIEKQNDSILNKYEPEKVKKMSHKEKLHLMEPPENYRDLPVLPSIEDIQLLNGFVRPNIVEGCYKNCEHYLDVQYRLLREDYIKPLRDGIAEYLRLKKGGKSFKHCKNVRVYDSVNIVMQQFVNGGLVHVAYFKDPSFSKIKWEYSKRFLTGSLLCFSADDFENMLFAIVARRDPEELKRGLVLLKFETLSDEILGLSPDTNFVVLETTAYFEAYRHNLKALLELNETNLPMKRYIVDVVKDVNNPKYLQKAKTYDMRPLLIPLSDEYIKHVPNAEGEIQTSYEFPSNLDSKAKFVNVLDDKCWPSCSELKLDPTQYTALKAAITKEFAVIQGPPGTGKTYIGLRITQLLLHNMNRWETNESRSPILVVCYTNHALDQFLEELSRFTQKIVRVGGRGQNESITKFQLNNLKRVLQDRRKVPFYIFATTKQKQSELHILKMDIDKIRQSIEDCLKNVLDENQIKTSMPETHYHSLKKCDLPDDGYLIQDWLGIRSRVQSHVDYDDNFDNTYSDGEENQDFNVSDLYSGEFVDIVGNEENQYNLNHEVNMLKKGEEFKQILTHHIFEIIENCEPFSDFQVRDIQNVWDLGILHRWKLYMFWTQCYISNLQQEYRDSVKQYQLLEEGRISQYQLLILRQHIQLVKNNLKCSLSTILSENVLKNHMPASHFSSLLRNNIDCKTNESVLYYWLDLKIQNPNVIGNRLEIIRNLKYLANHMKNFEERAFENNSVAVEGEIDSEGEADIEYLEAQRIIDSEEFTDVSIKIPALERKKRLIPDIDDGWKIQGGKKKQKQYIKRCLHNPNKMTETDANKITDVWSLPIPERWSLYKYWLDCYIENKNKEIFGMQQQLRDMYEEMCELQTEQDMYICRQAHVVGMTTTGAAKYRQIVQNLNPKIVIVEEAAEILESHLVTSLAPDTQHVILIGDHQQLRPSPTVHLLSVKYDLNISLFERMVQNGLDCHQLGIQHRMRPNIAALLVPHIYESLENHESVTKYENVKGVNKSVFFITHDFSESKESDSKSRVNEHEAKFLLALCRYFILQGYNPSQITVLTTYSGQLFALKKLRTKMLSSVRMTVVDNYQGEENDIILVSFVRSNEEGEIGFLKVSNRVCVALSRAKKGLFCIGNFNLLAQRSALWKNIVSVLHNYQAIGSSLQLICQNHLNTSNDVAVDRDFDSVPEGGCTRMCEARLSCGHVCPLMCHSYDREHETIKCKKPCNKICEYNHPCKKKCSEICGPCTTTVYTKVESCGHDINVFCHRRFEEIDCPKPCERKMKCGHRCGKKCGEICSVLCERLVTVTSIICGHKIEVACFQSENKDYLAEKCTEPCRTLLSCEHFCKGNCSSCHQGRLHIACTQPCKRILVCGHECRYPCSKSCPPCKNPCENRCIHSKCPKKCGEPCEKCTEPCEWNCAHKKCNLVCGDICDRKPCNEPCKKSLPCKHSCIGLCGEPCPKLCRICNRKEVTEVFFGSEDESDARFICLEDCDHIFEVHDIAKWMDPHNLETREIQMKTCPKCKTVIRKNLRFSNIIKSCLKDIEKVKMITYGDKKRNMYSISKLAKRVDESNQKLQNLCFPLRRALKSKKSRSMQEITIIENIILIAEMLVEEMEFRNIVILNNDSVISDSGQDLKRYLERTVSWINSFFQDEYLTASQQQLEELTWEVHRIKLANKFLVFIKEYTNVKSDSHFISILKCIMTYTPFREVNVQNFSKEFAEFTRKYGGSVINISDDEKKSILKAMGLAIGHWYQCPLGHVYCITECGGAMQVGKCNECGEKIGGTNHTLLQNNRVATAMDGSRHGAWSDAMNMDNYRFF